MQDYSEKIGERMPLLTTLDAISSACANLEELRFPLNEEYTPERMRRQLVERYAESNSLLHQVVMGGSLSDNVELALSVYPHVGPATYANIADLLPDADCLLPPGVSAFKFVASVVGAMPVLAGAAVLVGSVLHSSFDLAVNSQLALAGAVVPPVVGIPLYVSSRSQQRAAQAVLIKNAENLEDQIRALKPF